MLFTFAGGTGHFLPLVPFARAAETARHIVAFAGQADAFATVENAGFHGVCSRGSSEPRGLRS